MTAKEQLRSLVDELSEKEANEALQLITARRGGDFARWLDSLPEQDEEISEQPEPTVGTALRIAGYGQIRAVIVHPADFEIIENVIDAYRAHPPVESSLSDLELRADAATEAAESEGEYDLSGLADALDTA